jgi:hypothetical protein
MAAAKSTLANTPFVKGVGTYRGGTTKEFPAPNMAMTGPQNLLRNGRFESWTQGTSVTPDVWEDNSVGNVDRATTAYIGPYSCRIGKQTADGAVTRIWQSVKNDHTLTRADGQLYTFSIMVKTDQTTLVQPFIYDGTYKYGRTYQGADQWEELWITKSVDSAATDFDVGVELATVVSVGDVYFYLDCASLHFGQVPWRYTENPQDRSPICQQWQEDETRVLTRGCVRCEPYQMDGTLTGGSTSENVTYTLPYGCKKIIHVDVNVESWATASMWRYAHTNATAFTTTGFTIKVGMVGTNIPANEDYTFTGCIWMLGWDDEEEQWL